MATTPNFETVFTTSTQIACDGGPLGHPRVFLHIEQETGETTCPYCSRKYVYKPGDQTAA